MSETGAAQTVTFTAGQVPAGVHVTFSPTTLGTTGTTTMQITADPTAARGT
ncbi:MAG: hypothetical protein ABJA89_01010 [Lapillicoccus sp.]